MQTLTVTLTQNMHRGLFLCWTYTLGQGHLKIKVYVLLFLNISQESMASGLQSEGTPDLDTIR